MLKAVARPSLGSVGSVQQDEVSCLIKHRIALCHARACNRWRFWGLLRHQRVIRSLRGGMGRKELSPSVCGTPRRHIPVESNHLRFINLVRNWKLIGVYKSVNWCLGLAVRDW